jgi:hypothetical protein
MWLMSVNKEYTTDSLFTSFVSFAYKVCAHVVIIIIRNNVIRGYFAGIALLDNSYLS